MGVEYRWCFPSSVVSLWYVVLCVLCVLMSQCRMEPAAGSVKNPRPTADEVANVTSICQITGCNCTTQHKFYQIVNCTFDSKQVVDLYPGFLSTNVIELSVTGGQELRLHAHLFSTLRNFQRLRTDGTRRVAVKKHAFLNLTGNSLLVQLANCDSLQLETAAFKDVQGAVTAEVTRCGYVTVQRAVFSFLQDATFQDVPLLELSEAAFATQPRALGHHGPVTMIRFRSVIIPSLPKDVFKSSLAEVSLLNSEVRDVQSQAFSGNTISSVKITNSSLHRVRARAFSERTLLNNLLISGCRLHLLESEALLSATANLTIQHSNITDIHTGAINATFAKVVIVNNEFGTFHSRGFSFHDWSSINIENNVFTRLHDYSMDLPFKPSQYLDQYEFTFTGNEVAVVDSGALRFISAIMPNVTSSRFENNYFGYTCHCDIEKWLEEKLGENCASFSSNNFCTIDSILAQCYDVSDGRMNMKNFTDMFCENGFVLKCKAFSADANVGVNKKFSGDPDNSNLILGLVLGLVFLIAVCGTIVILLIHGGIWLKRKGYCVRFNKFNYRTDETSTEAEDIMVTVDKVPDNLPEELSQDLLQALREKLEDPLTYHEAREMIERLYDHFIIEDSYTNNNRQDEETHVYEELGNLQQPKPEVDNGTPTRPFSFLRLIEERFNLLPNEQLPEPKPLVLGEYSEPTDAEVHLYSELPPNGKEGKQNEINEGLTQTQRETSNTQRSNGSGKMAYRPLPDKPKQPGNDPGEGPSTKF